MKSLSKIWKVKLNSMQKKFTKKYLKYLLYRAFALGFMVVALNYFLFKNSVVGNLFVNLIFLVISVYFTMLYSKLKPPLSECLKKCNFWVSFIIVVGNTISFMGSVLFVVYFLSGRDVEFKNLLYLLLIGVVFGIAYFSRCKIES